MHTSRARRRAIALASAIAVALFQFNTSVLARAEDLQVRHAFKIPAQPLDTALLQFSDQAKVQVLMWSDTHTNQSSPGVTGDLPAAKALATILDNTGFGYQQVDSETVAILKVGAPSKGLTDYSTPQAPPKLRLAQSDSATGPAAPSADEGSKDAVGGDELSTVTVTGSHIIRDGFSTPTPTTVIGAEQIQDSGKANIADVLNEMPAFQGSITGTTGAISLGGQSGGNYLNLRNLGATRTLVLFDGRRFPPEFATNLVDTNLLPDALIERVDVVTGGASAVYGSDAVAGVVNFVLNTNFTGLKVLAQGGVTGHGDGANDKIQVTFGTKFADGRGHFLISADQDYQAGIPGDARSWNQTGYYVINNPAYTATNGQPYYITRNQVGLVAGNPGGIITGGALKGTAFGAGGVPFQWDYGSLQSGRYQVGGDWSLSSEMGGQAIELANNSRHLFTHLSYDVNDHTQVFAEFNGAQVHTNGGCCYQYFLSNEPSVGLHVDNPYIPTSVEQKLLAAGYVAPGTPGATAANTNIPYGMTFQDRHFGAVTTRWTEVEVLGAKGDFDTGAINWKWNGYLQRGISTQQYGLPWEVQTGHFMQAIDVVQGPNGPECRSTLINPGNGCIPFNVFGSAVNSQAAYDYIGGSPTMRQVQGQNLAGGSITGEPFSTWAGPVSVAGSIEWRRDSIRGVNDPLSSQVGGWSLIPLISFNGSEHVTEGAFETVVPLLKDLGWAQSLEFNGAVRETAYSISGNVTTWKAGLTFQPVDAVRFRFTQSRDIRAPNLSELYQSSTNHNSISNPFLGGTAVGYYQYTVGNKNLKPEKADTTGLGIVLTPAALPGFSASIDYFNIKIKDVIQSPTYAYILGECFAGVTSYCSQLVGNPTTATGLIGITTQPINQAALLSRGIDYEVSYRHLLGPGNFGIRLVATQTMHLTTDTGIAGPSQVLDAAGTGIDPRWGGNLNLTYDVNKLRASWTTRFWSSERISNTLVQCVTGSCPRTPGSFFTIDNNTVPSYFVHNLSLTYRFLDNDTMSAETFLAVDNVFDKIPPNWPTQIAATTYALDTSAALYDTIGRAFRAGFRLKL